MCSNKACLAVLAAFSEAGQKMMACVSANTQRLIVPAVCPMKGVSGLMALLAQVQQLASSQISKYPQEAALDNADSRKCRVERLPVADQVCDEMFACAPTC